MGTDVRIDALTTVHRDETPVLYLEVADELADIQRGWPTLEERVSLCGRKFYGTFDAGRYRVCTELQDGDDADRLQLLRGVIPGGRFARLRMYGEPPELYEHIGTTFAELKRQVDVDETRPGVEFYKRHNEIHLLAPIK